MARWIDRLGVSLYKVRWIRERWARRFRAPRLAETPWTPLSRPVRECRLALVTTGGIHLRGDRAFDMQDPEGDPTFRLIPIDAAPEALEITDIYYDHRDADRDPNLVLPLAPLHAALREGWIGSAAPEAISLMGHILGRRLEALRGQTAPEIARRLLSAGARIALLVPA